MLQQIRIRLVNRSENLLEVVSFAGRQDFRRMVFTDLG